MKLTRAVSLSTVLLCAVPVLTAAPPTQTVHRPPTAAEVLAGSTAADWRALDPQNTLYLELATGRVVIELAPEFAPNHVANVLALSRGKYFDGLPIERAFAVFTEQFGDFKPREHNLLAVPIAETVFEPRVGGHIYDRGVDGSVCRWARILAYEPPSRVLFTWDIGPTWQLEADPLQRQRLRSVDHLRRVLRIVVSDLDPPPL